MATISNEKFITILSDKKLAVAYVKGYENYFETLGYARDMINDYDEDTQYEEFQAYEFGYNHAQEVSQLKDY